MPKLWEKTVTLELFQKRNPLPETPGVYFFLTEDKKLLYIGKATSLRDRVRSYFVQDLLVTRGPKVAMMLPAIRHIGYKRTDSVLEALILEAALIKVYQPSHNTDQKDDKSYNHVVITEERFPRVLTVRGRDLEQKKFTEPIRHLFGPFPNGGSLREGMRIIRKIFPYRDKCEPFERTAKHPELVEGLRLNKEALRRAQDRSAKARPCFNAQIGLCPGVCVGKVTAREYAVTIRNIALFFSGRKEVVVKRLERSMQAAAKRQDFEEAARLRNTLFGLRHIQDMALIKDDLNDTVRHRIEAYDVAHLGGTASVGVMTVVQNGKSAPSEYRQFKLKGKHNGNDLTALREILERRLGHPEWPLPELVAVDGGPLQVGVARAVLTEFHLTIPVLGVVKDDRHRPDHLEGEEELAFRFKKEILLANAEAHRFAITFHRKRRSKEFLGKT